MNAAITGASLLPQGGKVRNAAAAGVKAVRRNPVKSVAGAAALGAGAGYAAAPKQPEWVGRKRQ